MILDDIPRPDPMPLINALPILIFKRLLKPYSIRISSIHGWLIKIFIQDQGLKSTKSGEKLSTFSTVVHENGQKSPTYAFLLAKIHSMPFTRIKVSFCKAYQAFEKSVNAFFQGFRIWELAWALEALYAVEFDL